MGEISKIEIDELFDHLRPAVRRLADDMGVTGEQLLRIVKRDKHIEPKKRFVEFFKQVAAEVGEVCLVKVDYTQRFAIARAIMHGGFKNISYDAYPHIHSGKHAVLKLQQKLPLAGTGKTIREVYPVHIQYAANADAIASTMADRQLKFVDPLTMLQYHIKHPNHYRELGNLETLFRLDSRWYGLSVWNRVEGRYEEQGLGLDFSSMEGTSQISGYFLGAP